MPSRTGLTVPFENRKQVKDSAKYLDKNFNSAYGLVFRLAANSGLRISDVLNLKYSDFDFEKSLVRIHESKGTKQAIANAKQKVYKEVKNMLMFMATDSERIADIYLTAPKNIMALVPDRLLAKVEATLAIAVSTAKPKKREVEFPLQIMNLVKIRMRKFKDLDDGYLFARKTLSSNRTRNMEGVLHRSNVWAVFSTISKALKLSINTSCHQLRKSFALFLYYKSGKDMALVVHTLGWKDNSLLMRYLSLNDEQSKVAVALFQRGYT